MLTRLEMSRLLHEFEDSYRSANTASGQHHENTPSTQKRFHNEVHDLMQTVDKYGNPFLDDFPELIHLCSELFPHLSDGGGCRSCTITGRVRMPTVPVLRSACL